MADVDHNREEKPGFCQLLVLAQLPPPSLISDGRHGTLRGGEEAWHLLVGGAAAAPVLHTRLSFIFFLRKCKKADGRQLGLILQCGWPQPAHMFAGGQYSINILPPYWGGQYSAWGNISSIFRHHIGNNNMSWALVHQYSATMLGGHYSALNNISSIC